MSITKSLAEKLSEDNIKRKFSELLGNKARGFMTSILTVVRNSEMLKQCEPETIIYAASVAASLDLPIDSNLGFSAIIPFKDKSGKVLAQFQIMYKGFIQLALRTGQYQNINACEIYEGELESFNRVTGEVKINPDGKKSDKIIGFVAYFRLLNGFEKTMYMPESDMQAHGKRFSQTYKKGFGLWKDDFTSMGIKTVLKRLLSKYGILSIDMQTAVKLDQSIVKSDDFSEYDYVDHENEKSFDDNDQIESNTNPLKLDMPA